MDKEIILAAIDEAFGSIPRPTTMVRNPNHCEECADHEAVMQSVAPKTLTLKEIGHMGMDPVYYLTDHAYNYFMPGFARLVLYTIDDDNSYLDQFTIHLETRSRIETFTNEQRRAITQLVDYLCETIYDDLVVKTIKPSYLEELERLRDKFAEDDC